MVAHDPIEAPDVLRQGLGRDGGVLYERQRLGAAGDVHHQSQSRLAHGPDLRLVLRAGYPSNRVPKAGASEPLLQPNELRVQLGVVLSRQFHDEHRLRVAVDEVHHAGVLEIGPSVAEDHAADELHCRRLKLQSNDGGFHGLEEAVEVKDRQCRGSGDGHKLHLGLGDGGQRAFGADNETRHVEAAAAARELVQVVARNPTHYLRVPGLDLPKRSFAYVRQPAVDGALQSFLPRLGLEGLGVNRAEPGRLAVGEDRAQLEDVVHGLAPDDGMGTARVIADGAADGGTVAGARIGGELDAAGVLSPWLSSSRTTPGWTRAQRSSTLTSNTLRMCLEKSMTTASPTVWPARLVPAPRDNTATRYRPAVSITAATSSALFGSTTPSGSMRYMLASVL